MVLNYQFNVQLMTKAAALSRIRMIKKNIVVNYLFVLVFIIQAKLLRLVLSWLKKGNATSLPGILIELYFPSLIKNLTKNYKQIIVISGTNGKTTTRSILVKIFSEAGFKVCTNLGGANIYRGISTSLLFDHNWPGKPKSDILILEIEEATLPKISKYLKVDKLILTNLFRDQLDLYGEIDVTLNYFKKSLALLDSEKLELIINSDDAKLVGLTGLDLKAKILGFGLNIPNDKKPKFELDYILWPETIINNLWELSYINKDKSSAKSDVSTSFVITKSSKNQFLGAEFETNLNGNYNLYNCLAAILASSEISVSIIQKALKMQTEVFGRGEIIEIKNTKIKIILVKNPASFDQVLDQISESEQIENIAFLINDNIADGRDVSWLWDINFENYLPKIKLGKVLTGGTRGMDMLLRLEYAGLKVNLENNQDSFDSLLSKMQQSSNYTVLCTYTAMTELRELLAKKVPLKSISGEGN